VHCSATDTLLRRYRRQSRRRLGKQVPRRKDTGLRIRKRAGGPCIALLRTRSYAVTGGKAADGWGSKSRAAKTRAYVFGKEQEARALLCYNPRNYLKYFSFPSVNIRRSEFVWEEVARWFSIFQLKRLR
jgi:hypothetical protein